MKIFTNPFMSGLRRGRNRLGAAVLLAASMSLTALGAPFTPGDLVVLRVGDGTTALSGSAAPVFLDEYRTNGILVQSVALPTTVGAGSVPNQLTDSGTATSDGMITRSVDGRFIVVPGYAANVGTVSVATGSGISRTVGLVKYDASIDTTTAFLDGFVQNNFRSAASLDGNLLWLVGNGQTANRGARATTKGLASTANVDSTLNARCGAIYGGNLWYDTQLVLVTQTGLPTTTAVATTNVFTGGTVPASMYQFVVLTVPGGTVCYIADDSLNGILKYSVSGNTLTYRGTIAATGIRGLTGSINGSTVYLYGTTGGSGSAGGGTIYAVTDTAAAVSAPSTSAATSIATATTQKAFRGIAFAPQAPAPAPTVQGPEYFSSQAVLPPPNTVYISPAQWHALFASGIVIRDVRHRFFTQNFPLPPLGGTNTENFSSEVDYELSTDNGATFHPATGTASVTVQVVHAVDSSGTSFFSTEMTQLSLSSPGLMLRESPTLQSTGQTSVRPVGGGYMINSFFDIFTEVSLDGGATWTPANSSGHMELRNDPQAGPSTSQPTDLVPPPNDHYVSPQEWHALYAAGIVIKNASHKLFTGSLHPPTSGATNNHSFNSTLNVDISTDGGATFQSVQVSTPVQVTVANASQSPGNSFYDTEMTGLSLSLPSGLMIRESPTLPSRGATETILQGDGTYRIDSFFDIFTELSTDGGSSWSPSTNGPIHMQLTQQAPEVSSATPELPVNGQYVSPEQWHAFYASGIIISNVSHYGFLAKYPLPIPGGSQVESFGSTVSGMISLNGGASFQPFSAPANVDVQVTSRPDLDTGNTRFFDTEMLSLSLSGGTLPGGVQVRESPTKASSGRASVRNATTEYRISSFFDVFTEVSLDGGATWSPAITQPGTMATTTNNSTPVSLTCPSNMTVPATGPSGATVFFSPSASGGCSSPNVAANPPSGSTFPVGDTTVYVTASDTCGNSAQCSFLVTVTPESQPPTLDCPTNIIVGATSAGAVVNFTVGYSGGCPPVTVITYPYSSGATFPVGTTTEYAYFYDCNGFETLCSFDVTVTDTNATAVVVTCPSNLVATATSGSGAVVNFNVGVSGGCQPVYYYTTPYSSGSVFPIGTTTEYVYIYDSCVGYYTQACSFTVTVNSQSAPLVNEYFTPQPLLPAPSTVYISPATWHALFANGVVIRDVRHRFFTQNYPLPPLYGSATENFSSEVDFQLSTDAGASFHAASGTASVTVQITHSLDNNGISFFDTEMTQLSLTGSGFLLRESPTVQSSGQATVRPTAGGYMVSSFFDIFTEVSLDNGGTWMPANSSGHMELRPDPKAAPTTSEPTPLLPPPNDHYVSPAQWHALYAQGIVIKDVSHTLFTGGLPPPSSGNTNTHSFNSTLHLKYSTDGGNTFQSASATAPVSVTVQNASSSPGNSFYDTEMTGLGLSLPGGIMVRESPTRPSRGATEMTQQSDGTFHINSFFDVFTELSTDGGASWSPVTNGPVRMQLAQQAPEVTTTTANLPLTNQPYVSPAQWHALYANGIIITNVSHDRFTQTQPPPPPAGSQTENFGSQVTGMISLNGGASFQPFSAPASVAVQVNSRSDLDNGGTRFFDTEMLSLSLSGGTLPGGVMVRESPSKASSGRTSERFDGSQFHISSFFDIFTEVSLDGGQSWTPSVSGPGTMSPATTNNGTAINLNCSSNIIVQATSGTGATVFYTVSATGGCSPPPAVSANPPSGSTFPIGTTTVFVSASDSCGNSAQCSFTVTVTVPPISLSCPSNQTAGAYSGGGTYVYYNPTATGGCTPPYVYATPSSGSYFYPGTTLVTVTASDSCGNSTNCSFSVTVTNIATPPIVLTCPGNITTGATSGSGATVFYSANATGGCSPPPYVYGNPPSGSTFPIGTTSVTVTGSDSCGNYTNCSFDVTVTNASGSTPIVLACPTNMAVSATGSSGATVFYTASATGGCTPPSLVGNPPSGSTFPIGTTLVTVTAHDSCSQTTNCTFTVTVTRPPINLTCPANISTGATGPGGATVFFTPGATGGCTTPFVNANPSSGSTFPLGTTLVTVTASDSCGTSTNCNFTVTVTNTPVTVNCPSNINVAATSSSGATVFYTATASGGCTAPFVSGNPPSGSTFPIGTTLVTVTANDSCGNSSQCSFNVTVTNTPITLNCPTNITVTAAGPSGAVVFYTVSAGGGCNPPPFVSANPPSGSTFPIGTTTVFVSASDSCGNTANCSFTVTVNPQVTAGGIDYFFPLPLLPPVGSVYISPAQWHVLFANGIVIRDVRHRFFTQHYPLPPLGGSQTESFGSELDFQLSTDNGATFQPASGTANVTVQVTHSQDIGGTSHFDTEMLQLDLIGPGFILRESPTLQSTGQTTVRPVAGGYMIDSFFDIFTEVSLDGGATWTPAQQPGHVELHPDPAQVTPAPVPTPVLPAPGGAYVSPQQWHALYAQGIVIKDVSHKFFTGGQLPPAPGATNVHNFNSQVDLQLSTDGGTTFQFVRVAAPVQVTTASHGSSSDTMYDTEMTGLSLSLPGGIMVRESPTLPSRGEAQVDAQGDGSYRISSFFDIFTELSLDGGASWSGATSGPVRVELQQIAPEVAKPTPNLPPLDGAYVSPAQWHALYANGIIITNASHDRFTQTQPPPPPGGSQVENFGSTVTGLISLNGGASFQPFSASASVAVQVSSRADLDIGNTRFFDTEMLSLSLSGGTLPGGVMVRESPSKASLGRTSERNTGTDYRISSFFDIFTEVSLDGGATWSPMITKPAEMTLATNPSLLSADLQVTKTASATNSAAGSQVVFTIAVANLGPNDITNSFVVTDCLPSGYIYITDSTVGGGGIGVYSPGTCQWTLVGLGKNVTVYLYITAVAATAGSYTNTAVASLPAGYTDPNTNNNSSSVSLTIYPVYFLSGTVRGCQTNGPAIPFTTVTLSGAASRSTTTDTNGNYSFSNLVAGTYTVTPTQPGNTFNPASRTVALSSNTNLPAFVGQIGQIRGRITYGPTGAGIGGIYLSLTGATNRTMITDANGVYAFTNTPPGMYTVTPVNTNGYVMTPTNITVVIAPTNCVAQASFIAQQRIVLLVALEVNQSIQDWSNSVPLVKDKETIVRAFLQLPSATNPPVLLQNARLYGASGGSPLAGSPRAPMNSNGVFLVNTANAAAGRSNFVNSLNFRVPTAWLNGTISLTFSCTNDVTVVPTNVVPANKTVTVTFAPVAKPQIKFFGINWTRPNGTTMTISDPLMINMRERLRAAYPVASVDAKFTSWTLSTNSLRGTNSALGDNTVNAYPDLDKINNTLLLARFLDSLFLPVGNRIYYGAIAGLDYTASGPQPRPSYGSAIDIPGLTASGFVPANPYGWPGDPARPFTLNKGTGRQTHSHEVGHDLGLHHAVSGPLFGYDTYVFTGGRWVETNTAALSSNSVGAFGLCGEVGDTNVVYPLFQLINGLQRPALGPMNKGTNAYIFGLDTLTLDTTNKEPVLSPFQYFDLMSYCRNGLEDRWPSTYTYGLLMASINGRFTAPPAQPPLGQLRRWWFIRGLIDLLDPTNNVSRFEPFVAVDTAAIPPSPPAGPYVAVLRDGSGNILNTVSFMPNMGENDDPSDLPAAATFLIPVPIDPVSQPVPIRQVQITDGMVLLADISGSPNTPTVSSVMVTATNGSPFPGSGIAKISWAGFDADANTELTYTVQYSSAGGTNWQTLSSDLIATTYLLDSLYLAASSQAQVRVMASDGFNCSDPAYSSVFTVNPHPPAVDIAAPMDSTFYFGDQEVSLAATAEDPQDGSLDGSSVVWTSSKDGALGSGASLSLAATSLSEGTHHITVTAMDSAGLTNSAGPVTVYVLRESSPQLSITLGGTNILVSWPSSQTNYMLESTLNLAPSNWSPVTNVPSAADILQTVNLKLSNTNRFFRLHMP